MIDIEKAKNAFEKFLEKYSDKEQLAFKLKVVHTYHVVDNARLIAEIHNKTEDVMNNRVVKEQPIEQRGHVRLIPDKKPLEPVKPKQPEPPKEEVVEKVEEQPLDLLIDELERPE